MQKIAAIIVALFCSSVNAKDYYSGGYSDSWDDYYCHSSGTCYQQSQCQTYYVPVSNLYSNGRYVGTRYELRTYCDPIPQRLREPTNHILQSYNDRDTVSELRIQIAIYNLKQRR